jgi:hypothetical protein
MFQGTTRDMLIPKVNEEKAEEGGHVLGNCNSTKKNLNYVARVGEGSIPTERQPSVGEVSANLCE